ncbi:MAG: hypothetical protein A2725_00205 [Candidatus Magasanikbacteria bacterium RIFCSPHIGHO2_01_FULL_33_34]|uniref:Glycosyltransferase RgtA/B/C/D-like domain-containing protein n=1 Tax=Candidatus Magasanikbacteria bacterium RIFCSPHIGHO2_01_FULL_33_34 TaxID=1798671 RepID=A0A1F6LL49_9BACT|nr:MAG: hypothetical protein A2725_00205 [Candidatus Magasanikbacteria bacterium RIFCSPHIGHO2_01_FULL_33_34]OGH65783.1 MAG: hypothetical protein A3B83_02875 [Candidatus Magasanikbacteria bacterium RIFCSPHIGHO2_02_FULL_33_17]OGH75148.1 MAG: hypothetical protein A3A89_03470 [Candidatus Magasanikbacteria bacterium RIFCSPLOWO2_01_FULL_33_34]OGH81226.1 MAG: hypothetical protein A3F93_04170 [Candidatus Magasanikbacteria bacterium RIFCSPLOWO2_12_FULL_34_7]
MKYLKKLIFYFSSVVVFILLYFNLMHWNKLWLGVFVGGLFFVLNGIIWQKILGVVFAMKNRDFVVKLYSWFAVFLLLSFTSSVWVVWYKITPEIIWLIFLIVQLVGELVFFVVKRSNPNRNFICESRGYKYSFPKNLIIKKNIFYIIFFILLWLSGVLLLVKNTSTQVLNSPWQTISQYYIIVFFFLTLILFFICLSKYKVKLVLFLLILHSVLLHIYLPVSHNNPWGGDVWRHIAIESKLISGEVHLPVLFGEKAQWREVLNIDLPEAFLIPNKYFYGQLWGSSVLISTVLNISLLLINIWLVPILWSIMIPIIVFRIGRYLFGSWRSGLLLALFVSVLFPFQALGGLTLPVSIGYLTFFFVLMLWLQYLEEGNVLQRNLVFLFAFLMLFGYSLHFILIWLVIITSLLIQYLSKNNLSSKNLFQNNFLRIPVIFVGVVILIFLFPIIEYIIGSSNFSKGINIFSNIIQIIGQFSGWYFVSSIRPHDILTGNIIFNHTPDYAFVSSIFMDFRWPVVLFILFLYVCVFLGIFWRRKKRDAMSLKVSQYIFLSVVSGYFISWFFMIGDHSLVRRLDVIFAFLLIVFALIGIFILFKRLNLKHNIQKVFVLLLGFIFSWSVVTTYASGPDMRVVSNSEYEVSTYLWNQVNLHPDDVCVLADTWPLLILEALSSQKIVGGGFPIDSQFGQKERVGIYNGILSMKEDDFLQKAHDISNKPKCFVVLPKSSINSDIEKFVIEKMNDNGRLVGDFVVFEELVNSNDIEVDE